jgi:ornithine cyclodeaminase
MITFCRHEIQSILALAYRSAAVKSSRRFAEYGGMRLIHLDDVRLRDGMRESGDLLDPVAAGVLDPIQVRDLATLISDPTVARRDAEEITVFKAVGTAIADLAVAQFFLRRHNETPTTGTGAIQ